MKDAAQGKRAGAGDSPARREPWFAARVRAAFERAVSPGLGFCYRCRRPWKVQARKKIGPHSWQQIGRLRWWGLIGVTPHSTQYSDSAACFPLCEGCWSKLTPMERLPYYDALVSEWIRQTPDEEPRYRRDQEAITYAVFSEAAYSQGPSS